MFLRGVERICGRAVSVLIVDCVLAEYVSLANVNVFPFGKILLVCGRKKTCEYALGPIPVADDFFYS